MKILYNHSLTYEEYKGTEELKVIISELLEDLSKLESRVKSNEDNLESRNWKEISN